MNAGMRSSAYAVSFQTISPPAGILLRRLQIWSGSNTLLVVVGGEIRKDYIFELAAVSDPF
jgi:hypothetical protein